MKNTISCYIVRDDEELSEPMLCICEEKPQSSYGMWVNCGNYIPLPSSMFPELTFDNSPQKANVSIEIDWDANYKFKQSIEVNGDAKSILDIPCVMQAVKDDEGNTFYLAKCDKEIHIVKQGDILFEDMNNNWHIRRQITKNK